MSTLQEVKADYGKLKLFVEGEWIESESTNYQQVMNPALDRVIAEVPICKSSEVDQAVKIANEAFEGWRSLPLTTRAGYIFKLKQKFDEYREDISRITSQILLLYHRDYGECSEFLELLLVGSLTYNVPHSSYHRSITVFLSIKKSTASI